MSYVSTPRRRGKSTVGHRSRRRSPLGTLMSQVDMLPTPDYGMIAPDYDATPIYAAPPATPIFTTPTSTPILVTPTPTTPIAIMEPPVLSPAPPSSIEVVPLPGTPHLGPAPIDSPPIYVLPNAPGVTPGTISQVEAGPDTYVPSSPTPVYSPAPPSQIEEPDTHPFMSTAPSAPTSTPAPTILGFTYAQVGVAAAIGAGLWWFFGRKKTA